LFRNAKKKKNAFIPVFNTKTMQPKILHEDL